MPTLVLTRFDNEAGRVEIDYNTLDRVTAVRAIVPVGRTITATVHRANGTGTTYTRTFPPGTSTLTIPTTTAGRIQLTQLTADGRVRIDGLGGWIEVS